MGQILRASSLHEKYCLFGGFAFFLLIENKNLAFLLNPELSSALAQHRLGSGAALVATSLHLFS